MPILERRSNPDFISDTSKLADLYNNNYSKIAVPKERAISQQCFDYISSICEQANFYNTGRDENREILAERLDMVDAPYLMFHDDSSKELINGFFIADDGIHSFIDNKRQDRFISFEKLAGINGFECYYHRTNQHRFIQSQSPMNIPSMPIVPYECVKGKSRDGKSERSPVIIDFLTKIRNACWVDLYL